jgi:hypothetical protein
MIKEEVVKLNVVLNELKEMGNTKFMYFVVKNLRLLKPHVEPLMEIEKRNKVVLTAFEEDRNKLILDIGKKGENGVVFIDLKDNDMVTLFNKKLQDLMEKHKTALTEFETKTKEYKKVLQEELEEQITFRNIDIEECPIEGISSKQLELLVNLNIIN